MVVPTCRSHVPRPHQLPRGTTMQAKETLFADLVQGRAQQFQVPLYQRTYSWTEKASAYRSVGVVSRTGFWIG